MTDFLSACAANEEKAVKQELYSGLLYHAVTTLNQPTKISGTTLMKV